MHGAKHSLLLNRQTAPKEDPGGLAQMYGMEVRLGDVHRRLASIDHSHGVCARNLTDLQFHSLNLPWERPLGVGRVTNFVENTV